MSLTTKRRVVQRAFGLLLAVSVLASCSGQSDDRKKTTPEAGFIVLKSETVSPTTTLAGRTAAFETSEVRPQVSGVLKARLFTEGTLVRAGQPLYQIDPSLYNAAAAQAQANLASAEASRAAAAAKAARYRPLAEMEAISKQDYTDALAASRQATASVSQTRAALDTARINQRFTSVPAPISGRIGRSLITTGGLVTANQTEPLATIQRLDPIFIDIQQSSTELLALRRTLAKGGVTPAAANVNLVLEDGSAYPYTGTLQFTEAVVDPNTGTVTLRARFPNPEGLLLPGMYVRARLAQETLSSAILVPQIGISRDPRGNATVLVVGKDNKAELRQIKADRSLGDKWIVTGGLRPGDKIIVEGLGKVKPGDKIIPVPAGSKPRAPKGSGSAKS